MSHVEDGLSRYVKVIIDKVRAEGIGSAGPAGPAGPTGADGAVGGGTGPTGPLDLSPPTRYALDAAKASNAGEYSVSEWTVGPIEDIAAGWRDITWSPGLGLFCAVAYEGTDRIATSPDGIHWTSRSHPNGFLYSVAWSPELSLFAVVCSGGTERALTSPDGVTWTSRTIEASSWRFLCWSPELNLFCAVAAVGTNRVATSPDGVTWTSRTAAEANGRAFVGRQN